MSKLLLCEDINEIGLQSSRLAINEKTSDDNSITIINCSRQVLISFDIYACECILMTL